MRRIGSFALAALLVTALGVSASATQMSWDAASGTAVIDGKMDDCYLAAEEIALNYVHSGNGQTTGTVRTVWDADNIYVLFDVTDPLLSTGVAEDYMYKNDCVEFFMDLTGTTNKSINNVNAGQYTGYAPIPGADFSVWGGMGGHWDVNVTNATYTAVATEKGYIVEMQIPWGPDFTPAPGGEILTCFHINSDEDGSPEGVGREGEIFANSTVDQTKAWQTSVSYDKLVLTDAVYVSDTPVVDTPVVDTPVVDTPVVDTPVVDTPVVDTPVVDTPVVDTPVVDTPVVDTPVVDTPVVDTPVVDTPVVNTPTTPTQSPATADAGIIAALAALASAGAAALSLKKRK